MDELQIIEQLNGALGATDSYEDAVDEASIGRLAKAGKIPAAAQKEVAKVVNGSVKRRLFNSTMTRGQKVLLASTGKLSTDNKLSIAKGTSQFTDIDKYIRRQLAGGGAQYLVKASDIEKIGLQNIQGNALAEGENMVVEKIKLAYGYTGNGGSTDPAQVLYTNAMDAETAGSTPLAIPFALLNGEFEVRQNGTTVLRLPVKKFFREGLSMGISTEGREDAVPLSSPLVLKSKEPFDLLIHSAEGVALPQYQHFIEVRLMGVGITPRR